MKIWNNPYLMLKDIEEHKKNGNTIVNDDKPQELLVGYRCIDTGKTWHVSTVVILKHCSHN